MSVDDNSFSSLTESSKLMDELLSSESLLARIQDSLDQYLGKKELPLDRLADAKQIVHVSEKPEGPKRSLARDLKEAFPNEDSPPWLQKIYIKLATDVEGRVGSVEFDSHIANLLNNIVKIYFSHGKIDMPPGILSEYSIIETMFMEKVQEMKIEILLPAYVWKETFVKFTNELRNILALLEKKLEEVKRNDQMNESSFSRSANKKSDFLLVLRLLVDKLESIINKDKGTGPREDEIIVVGKNVPSEATKNQFTPLSSKDEL